MSPDTSFDHIRYSIDSQNRIIDLGEGWYQAAEKGHAVKELAADAVIGRPIEDFIGGDVTQMYYDALFKLCRIRQEKITREYRCDSPTHKRFMQVTLISKEHHVIELFHETLREEPFEHRIDIEDMTHRRPTTIGVYMKRCSICNRLLPPGTSHWHPPESFAYDTDTTLKVIHTVCPDCKTINWGAKTISMS